METPERGSTVSQKVGKADPNPGKPTQNYSIGKATALAL